jgi:hypothetical protein
LGTLEGIWALYGRYCGPGSAVNILLYSLRPIWSGGSFVKRSPSNQDIAHEPVATGFDHRAKSGGRREAILA